MLVLVLSKIERLLTKGTRAFKLPITMIFIFPARNRAKSILRLTKKNFINRKSQNLAFSNSSRVFWHLAKNISSNFTSSSFPLLLSLTAVLPSLLSLKLNSFLKPCVVTLPWTILGIFLLLMAPPTLLCLLLQFFLMKFSMSSLASILRRLMDLMEYLLSFLRTVFPCWYPAWSNSFASACQRLPFLLAGSMATLMSTYSGLVRPRMEYASLVWGCSTHTAPLDRVESKALRLISSPSLTDNLPPKVRRQVGSFSIFCRYFHSDFSSDLANCMPPSLLRPRCTRLCTQAHPFSVQIPYARVNQHLHSFIPFTGKLWNNLPLSVFSLAYDLNSFKRRVSGHLSSWIWSLFLDSILY